MKSLKRDIVYNFLSMDIPSRDQLLLGMEILGQRDFADITDPNKRYEAAFQRLATKDEDFILQFKAAVDRHLQKPTLDFDKWKGLHFQSKNKKGERGNHFYSRSGDRLFVLVSDEPSMGMFRSASVTEHLSLKGNHVTGFTINNLSQLMRDSRPTWEQAGTPEFSQREKLLNAFGEEDIELSINEITASLNERDQRLQRAKELCDSLERSLEGAGAVGEPAKAWVEKVRIALAGGKA